MHQPIGGIKQIYRQVEVLNSHGYDACVLQKRLSAPKWFTSTAKIEEDRYLFKVLKYLVEQEHAKTPLPFNKRIKLWYLKITRKTLAKNAILVFPEIYGDFISVVEPSMSKVIFNQNAYKTFEHVTFSKQLNPYRQKNVLGTMVVSSDSEMYLKYCFPKLNIARIRLGIDTDIFRYYAHKKKQILYMARKQSDDVHQVTEILKTRIFLRDWVLIPINNKNENDVAKLMRESLLFLSFSHREGFGLPPAEAMACGCVVIGYTGGSGKEFFLNDFSYAIEEGNIIDYVKTIETIVQLYNNSPETLTEKGISASKYITQIYSLENEKSDIIQFWKKVLQDSLTCEEKRGFVL